MLDRLSAPLCDALLGSERARANCWRRSSASNLFLIPLDAHREWFRYHHLFQDLLRARARARARATTAIRALHRRAAAWLAREHGEIGEAIRHHLAAG